MKLKGKTAVITGASDGLGREITYKLAGAGVRLALVAKTEEKLKEVAEKASELGSPEVSYFVCDLRNLEEIQNTTKKISSSFPNACILINNAGIWQQMNYLEEIKDEEIEDIITTNLTGLIYITKYMLPILKKQDEAAIINISSKSGVTVQPGQSVYSATKWGVTGFSKVLKDDLKKTNVTVATVHQGGTNTNLFKKTGEHLVQDEFINPSDLAGVVVFMLSQPKNIWVHDVRVE